MQRTAIDSSGSIGSLYNAYRDCVTGRINVSGDKRASQLYGKIQCEIINADSHRSRNLLEMIGIQEDLRLSILLGLVPKAGIVALNEYSEPITEYARFLHLSYVDREQRLTGAAIEAQKDINAYPPQTDATHIITAVTFGIDIVALLQLPHNDDMVGEIDGVLQVVRKILKGDQNVSVLTTDHKNLLREIIQTKIYSNISVLNEMTSVLDTCIYMNARSTGSDVYRPLTYTMQPIKSLFPEYDGLVALYLEVEESVNGRVEQHLIQLSNSVKRLKHSLHYNTDTIHFEHLQKNLDAARSKWENLKKAYEDEIKRFQNLIVDIRSVQKDVSEIDQAFSHEDGTILIQSISELTHYLTDLKDKGKLIADLKKEKFDYCDVAERNANEHDDEQTLKQKLIEDDQHDRILCSSDFLKKQDQSKWEEQCCQLSNEHRGNSSLRLLYADFSYCPFELQGTIILSSNIKNKDEKLTEKTTPTPSTEPHASSSPLLPSSNDDIINILLLGESGVGKSTFINAFVNYLAFETLEQAQSNKPVVLIPVTFLMTIGDNFEERIVKFGELDALNNEDFDHPGQSVTQRCKSYIFNLHHSGGRKLRIIDTPGFGDTRGLDQDDLNMQHILEYINNLTHINAVCFLLKPNTSQLHTFFRTCLTQLLDLLGADASENIIFCFTNARSTFYTPGDTAPLLKSMLSSLSIRGIQLKRDNTYCFDNESFRYLVALKNEIIFSNSEQDEYKMSWSTSVNESNRLINYIRRDLTACLLQSDWQSALHAQIQIVRMIRPMLEAMRNILRNIVLHDLESPNRSIELIPKALHRPATACRSCKHSFIQAGNFRIVRDIPHEIQSDCYACSCSSKQHTSIDYLLNYKFLDSFSKYDQEQMKNMRRRLKHATTEFAYFLLYVACSTKDDPFLIGLVQMISEENDLCQIQKPSPLNLELGTRLRKLMYKYEERLREMNSMQQHSTLSKIYEWITAIRELPMVQEQMKAVKQTQEMMMKQSEYEVLTDLTNTSAHSTTTP